MNKKSVKSKSPAKTLSLVQRRLVIAKDALAQLKVGNFEAETGVYCAFDEDYDSSTYETMSGKEFQQFVRRAKSCNVCAKGALFLSAVRKYNTVSGDAFLNLEFDAHELRQLTPLSCFSKKLLREFEFVFEGQDIEEAIKPLFTDSEYKKLEIFKREDSFHFMSDSERLIFMLELFIKNKGRKLVL